MPQQYKLGKLPATRLVGVGMLRDYVEGNVLNPPRAVSVPDASYPMDGNDTLGDCTIAGVAHLLAAWDVEVKESLPVPDQAQVVSTYEQLTGGPDTGLNESVVIGEVAPEWSVWQPDRRLRTR